MAFGLGAFLVGIVCIVIGTRFRSTIAGSILLIVGSAITAVGAIFLGFEGLA